MKVGRSEVKEQEQKQRKSNTITENKGKKTKLSQNRKYKNNKETNLTKNTEDYQKENPDVDNFIQDFLFLP